MLGPDADEDLHATVALVQLALVALSTSLLCRYLAGVFGNEATRGGGIFGGLERLVHRACGVDPRGEQRWPVYARSPLAFSRVSALVVYALARLQGHLPLNPTGVAGQPAALSFNTAVTFVTSTNWQNYSGESGASHLLQMAGLAVQSFVSAAVGLSVAVARIRGLVRRRTQTIGNFWDHLVRGVVRVLVPLASVGAIVLVSQGRRSMPAMRIADSRAPMVVGMRHTIRAIRTMIGYSAPE